MLNIPAGWKLVPIEPTETMVVCGFESRPHPFFSKPEDWEAFAALTGCQQAAHKARLCYAAMLDAAPSPASVAPGDAQDERQAFEAWAKKKKMPLARIGQQYDDFWVDHAWNGWQARARLSAPAAGDAQLLEALKQAHMALIGFMPRHRNAVIVNAIVAAREAIDVALAAQVPQQGEA